MGRKKVGKESYHPHRPPLRALDYLKRVSSSGAGPLCVYNDTYYLPSVHNVSCISILGAQETVLKQLYRVTEFLNTYFIASMLDFRAPLPWF